MYSAMTRMSAMPISINRKPIPGGSSPPGVVTVRTTSPRQRTIRAATGSLNSSPTSQPSGSGSVISTKSPCRLMLDRRSATAMRPSGSSSVVMSPADTRGWPRRLDGSMRWLPACHGFVRFSTDPARNTDPARHGREKDER